MSGITLSAGVRQNLAALQATSALQSATQNRLATGKKVNSALDNPSSYFTASGLNNRANDLSNLLDTMGQAVKTIEAADKGLKAITKLVENAQSLANQAKATTEYQAATSATALVVTGSATPDATAIGNATSVTITIDGTDTAVDVSGATDMSSLITTLNSGTTGVTFSESSGAIRITHDTAGASGTIAVSGASASALFGTVSTTTAGADATSGTTADEKRASLAADFEKLRTQINQLVEDSGYNGVNLLKGQNLTVSFNEKAGGSSYTIEGKKSDSASDGLSISASSNSWRANSDVTTSINELTAAVTELRTSASSFGASLSVVQTRQDFTKGMVDTLKNGADELTNADMNQEAANLLSLQTRAQLANTALSMASQQDQGILRLF